MKLGSAILYIVGFIILLIILAVYFVYKKTTGFFKAINPFEKSRERGAGTVPLKKKCAAGERDDGVSCWLDTYGRGTGTEPIKAACPPGMKDDGTSCWAHSYDRPGYVEWDKNKCFREHSQGCEKWGLMWYPKCKSGYRAVGCCSCEPNGGIGIKKTLFERQECKPGEEKWGVRCYPKCKAGFRAAGCCLCEPDGGPRITKSLGDRQFCPDGEEMDAGLCYEKCQPGEKGVGPLCWEK